MERLKEIWADLLLIACLGGILAHLIMIKMYGAVAITERHDWILWVELGLVSLCIILGVERLIRDIK